MSENMTRAEGVRPHRRDTLDSPGGRNSRVMPATERLNDRARTADESVGERPEACPFGGEFGPARSRCVR